MPSLLECIRKAGLGRHEAAILNGQVKGYLDSGYEANKAAVQAVTEYMQQAERERSDIVRQIESANAPQAPVVPLERMSALREHLVSVGRPEAEADAQAALAGRVAMWYARQTGDDPANWPRWEGLAGGVAEGETLEQAAYHGSPYKFDKFSLEHIGKGEGVQAYGYGLYFASKKSVAESYRENLAKPRKMFTALTKEENESIGRPFAEMIEADGFGIVSAINSLQSRVDYLESIGRPAEKIKRSIMALEKLDQSNDFTFKYHKGQLYSVEIPEDNQLLDWDKPLSEQPEQIKKALESIKPKTSKSAMTGKSVYGRLVSEYGSQQAASEYLLSIGIPGLRYLDGTSRGKGKGSHNYVIWDEASIQILETLYQDQRGSTTFSPEFKAWFKDSKVVSKNGSPLVVWHGTDVEFDAFSEEFLGQNYDEPSARAGFFFSASKADAAFFGKKQLGFYLSMQHPLVITEEEATSDERKWIDEARSSVAPDHPGYDNPDYWRSRGRLNKGYELAIERARAGGHDGVIMAAEDGPWGSPAWFVVFSPTQIKSTKNKGEWASQNPSVMHQGGDATRGSTTFTADGQAILKLFETADASTFPHELAHIFRRDFEVLANAPTAGEQLKADWAAAQAWVKATPGQTWTTAQEEQWARGFEAYLMEGRAPAQELRGVFERFRSWLVSVYRGVKALGVRLDPNIRGVFDRLVASDEEIAMARASEIVQPLFTERPPWMPEGVWATYQGMTTKAQLSVADRVMSRRLGEWRKARVQWEEEARAEHAEMHGGQPHAWIMAQGKLNSKELVAVWGAEDIAELERRGLASAKGKVGLEAAAVHFGITPDELVMSLAENPTEAEHVEAYVNARSREMDATTPSLEAALTDEVLDLAKREAEMLAGRMTNPKLTTMKEDIRRATRAQTLGELESSMVSEREALRFGLRRAALAARKAMSEGKRLGAAKEKERQVELASRLKAREDVRQETTKIRADFKRLLRNKPGLGKGIEYEYDAQIRHLLANYGIGARSRQTELEGVKMESFDHLPVRGQSLREFVDGLQESGETISPPEWILAEQQMLLPNMTFDQLQAVHQTAMQLAKIGRGQNEMLAHMRGATFAAAVEEVIEAAGQARQRYSAPGDKPPEFNQDALGRINERQHKGIAEKTKAEFIAYALDGGERLGKAWENLFWPIKKAEDKEFLLSKEFSNKMLGLLKMLPKEFVNNLGEKHRFEALKDREQPFLTNEQILAAALNMGNKGNRDALLAGWQINEAQLQEILAPLPPEAWNFVQGTWDLLDEVFVHADETYYLMTGTHMTKVEPLPVRTPEGELRGGYYPLKWDSRASSQAAAFLIKQAQKDYFENPFASGRPEQGFTETRVGGKMAPLLSLSVLHKHLSETIHYASYAPAIRDVNKLVSSPKVAAAITRVVGPAKYEQFKPWLQRIAKPELIVTSRLESMVNTLVNNNTVAALAYNLKTVLSQPLAFFNSMNEVGAIPAAEGMLHYLAHPVEIGSWIEENSPYMANRRQAMDRDLASAVQSKSKAGATWDKFAKDWGFYLIGLADNMTAKGLWLAAYNQELEASGNQERAKERADAAVRTAHGSSMPKDMAAIQRGSVLHRAMSMFYTPFSANFNLMAEAFGSGDITKVLRTTAYVIVLPAVFSALLDWAWDEAKGNKNNRLTIWRILLGIPDYALAMFPIARMGRGITAEAINAVAGERIVPPGMEARGLPMVSDPINRAMRGLAHAGRGQWDRAAMDTVEVLGPVAGVPSNAIVYAAKIGKEVAK